MARIIFLLFCSVLVVNSATLELKYDCVDNYPLFYYKDVSNVSLSKSNKIYIPIKCYSGNVFILTARNLNSNQVFRIEASYDLKRWFSFPCPGFQINLTNNQSFVNPIQDNKLFFRGLVR